MRAAAVLVSVAALALTGCGSAASPVATDGPVTAGGPAATSGPVTTDGPVRTGGPGWGGPVTVERSGGIAGVRDQVVAQGGDGTWRRTARGAAAGTGTLTSGERSQMQVLVTDPALREEAQRPSPAISCADGFHYRVTVGETVVGWTDCGPAAGRPGTAANIAHLLLGATE
jgi:hypothetical protein